MKGCQQDRAHPSDFKLTIHFGLFISDPGGCHAWCMRKCLLHPFMESGRESISLLV